MLGVVSWNRLNHLKPRGANHHVLPPMESTNVQGRQMEYPPGNQHIPPWEKENHLQKCLVKLQPSLVKLQPSTLVFRKWTDHQPPPGWSSNFLHPEGGCIQVMLQTKTPKVGFRGRNDGGHYMTPPQTMPYYSRKIPQNYHIFAACFFPPNSWRITCEQTPEDTKESDGMIILTMTWPHTNSVRKPLQKSSAKALPFAPKLWKTTKLDDQHFGSASWKNEQIKVF